MANNFKPIDCNDDEVLCFPNNITYKLSKLEEVLKGTEDKNLGSAINSHLSNQGASLGYPMNNKENIWKWLDQGIDCELLKLGSNKWQKIKIKIKIGVEILAEESEAPSTTQPESPLDEIRQMLKESNQ